MMVGIDFGFNTMKRVLEMDVVKVKQHYECI